METAAITLADVNESTPENVAITETPALGGATPIGVVTYTITGGEDQGLFTIDAATGAVTLLQDRILRIQRMQMEIMYMK
ncbi:cadherin repeat domain-containing protein [Tenacibaculum maritimum]|uniref:cadherin repeat domain-containing protein n=1 Tax=Tenacibaculum maritimum TaxID=107401 RepID=UPI003890CB86